MRHLHDPTYRADIEARLRRLAPDSRRQWGKMSVDQMLRHLNIALESALGRVRVEKLSIPLPGFLLKWGVLYAPWPRSAPTAPEFVAGDRYDFEGERSRCLGLIDELASRPLGAEWPAHQTFGRVTGAEVSRLHAKHLDHHLKQFSA